MQFEPSWNDWPIEDRFVGRVLANPHQRKSFPKRVEASQHFRSAQKPGFELEVVPAFELETIEVNNLANLVAEVDCQILAAEDQNWAILDDKAKGFNFIDGFIDDLELGDILVVGPLEGSSGIYQDAHAGADEGAVLLRLELFESAAEREEGFVLF
jgi:hypothetical protein